jgi:hypothetical protein
MKYYRKILKFLPLLPVLILFSCWAYSFSASALGGAKSIGIAKIDNNTTEYGLEDLLINKLNEAFESDNTLKVVPVAQADLILDAAITKYSTEPYIYSEAEATNQYKCTVTLDIKIEYTKSEKILWEDQALSDFGVYSPDNGETQTLGDERAIDKLITEIMNRTVRGW